jgi:hypothetical protein
MARNAFGDRALAAIFVSVIWLLTCGIVPIFFFGGFGHGSIFLAMPIWWEGVAGALLHSAAVFLLPLKSLDLRKTGMLIGLSAVLATSAYVIFLGGIDVLTSMYGLVFWIMLALGTGIPLGILRFTRGRSPNAAS